MAKTAHNSIAPEARNATTESEPSVQSVAIGTVMSHFPAGSDLRLDIIERIHSLIKRGRSDDEIADEIVDTLAQRPALSSIAETDIVALRKTVLLLIAGAHKGRV